MVILGIEEDRATILVLRKGKSVPLQDRDAQKVPGS